MPIDRDLAVVIADLQRQRKELERLLDDTNRSHEETTAIVDKIVILKKRSTELLERRLPGDGPSGTTPAVK